MNYKSRPCPYCKKRVQFEDNKWWPFCSERCKIIDLGHWAMGTYKIPGEKILSKSTKEGEGDEKGSEK
jgi:endogenous inhibitor of DNA gyrase (YacG/DUF329 family)